MRQQPDTTETAYEIAADSLADRSAWLKAREQGIGGSDAPIIMGVAPWGSPTEVQMAKWGLAETEENEAMKWGRKLERVILDGFSEEIGAPVPDFGWLLRSKHEPILLCTPDGQVATDDPLVGAFVQAKATQMDWEEKLPDVVWVQVQHEMAVTGHPMCYAVALCRGAALRWREVERDEEYIDQMVATEREFWEFTENKEPWPKDYTDRARQALAKLYPKDTGETVALSAKYAELADGRSHWLAMKEKAKTELTRIETEFRREMKDATYGALPDGRTLSLKAQTRKEHTVKETTFRVLRIQQAKE